MSQHRFIIVRVYVPIFLFPVARFFLEVIQKENPCDKPGFIILFLVIDTEKKENSTPFVIYKSALKYCRYENFKSFNQRDPSDSDTESLNKERQISLTYTITNKYDQDSNPDIESLSILLNKSNLNDTVKANEIFINTGIQVQNFFHEKYQEIITDLDLFSEKYNRNLSENDDVKKNRKNIKFK